MRSRATFAVVSVAAVLLSAVLFWRVFVSAYGDPFGPAGAVLGFVLGLVLVVLLRPLFALPAQIAIFHTVIALVTVAVALLAAPDYILVRLAEGVLRKVDPALIPQTVGFYERIIAFAVFAAFLVALNVIWSRLFRVAAESVDTTVLVSRISALSDRSRERLLFELEIPRDIVGGSETGRATRIATYLEQQGRDAGSILAKVDEVEREYGWRKRLAIWIVEGLRLTALIDYCEKSQRLGRRPEAALLRRHQAHMQDYFERFNAGPIIYQSATVTEKPENRGYDPHRPEAGKRMVDSIRQTLRVVSGLSTGGDRTSAQLASINRNSRIVRNAVRLLVESAYPIILLGDPGSGKSVTLRQVGLNFCSLQRRRLRPSLIVYVRLGRYLSRENDSKPGSVISLIKESLVPEIGRDLDLERSDLEHLLPLLIAEGRMVILFDGMDEMERSNYSERVAALSEFAMARQGQIKTLFACRINDFTPQFTHQQMVLMPFGRKDVETYIGRVIDVPIEIDGETYSSHKRLAATLIENSPFGDSIYNPLILHLICRHINDRKSWPQTRVQVFEDYVMDMFAKYARRRGGEADDLPRGPLMSGLAALALDVTWNSGGTIADVEVLRDSGGELSIEDFREHCTGAGLLLPVPEEASKVMFSHHRIQEFFAARALSAWNETTSANAALVTRPNWERLLDNPRWQETLIFLAVYDPRSPAISALVDWLRMLNERIDQFDSIDAMESQPSESTTVPVATRPDAVGERLFDNPIEERICADRVVLASHIVREVLASAGQPGGDTEAATQLSENLMKALGGLSRLGRPTTQVRMLWAWRNAPGEDTAEFLAPQLTSKLSWVRGQALLILAFIARMGIPLRHDIVSQMALDLANGRFLGNIKAYAKSSQQAGKREAGALCAAVVSSASHALMVLAILAVGIDQAVVRLPFDVEVYAPVAYCGYPVVIATAAYLLTHLFEFPGPRQFGAACIYGLAAAISLHVTLYNIVNMDGVINAIALSVLFAFGAALSAGALSFAAYWLSLLPFAVYLRIAVRKISTLELVQIGTSTQRGTIEAGMTGAAVVLGSVAGIGYSIDYALRQAIDGYSFGTHVVGPLSVLFILVMVYSGLWEAMWTPKTRLGVLLKILASIPIFLAFVSLALLVLGLVGIVFGWLGLAALFEWLGAMAAPVIIGLLLLLAAALVCSAAFFVIRGRVRRITPRGLAEWREGLRKTPKAWKLEYLQRTDLDSLRLTPVETLHALYVMADEVRDHDEAASYIHSRILELEQILRQTHLQGEDSPSTPSPPLRRNAPTAGQLTT